MSQVEVRQSTISLCCPDCHRPLDKTADELRCRDCSNSWPVRDDVPDFTDSSRRAEEEVFDAYGRSLPDLVRAARRDGWLKALQEVVLPLPGIGPGLFAYVTDQGKGDLVYALDIHPGSCVLDLGCGLGTVSAAVAARGACCWSVDVSHDQAAFAAIRAQQMGFSDAKAVAAGDDMKLPFADGSFDAVIMNGVLEWVGCADRFSGSPEQAQLAMLREVCRTLKTGGQLYVSSKNRFALIHFLGAAPDHGTKRRWIGMLRPALQTRLTFGRVPDSRARIHGLKAYKRLFEDAGYEQREVYALMPEFRRPKRMVPLQHSSPVGLHASASCGIYTRRLEQLVASLIPGRVLKHLVYCYGFVLEKK